MDDSSLTTLPVRLPHVRVGPVQRSGPMAVLPLFGPDAGPRFLPPLTGLKLKRVAGYGNVEMECRGDASGGVAIVPLHIGYIQDKAQNHALCRSALIGAGQKLMFEDACCVQQAQGGYLEGRDQWFFVLPIALRDAALRLRGKKDYSKLWTAIAKLNAALGLAERGHLEQIVCHERYWLTQYASRFELCEGQTGALFFLEDKLAGIELAPNAEYFAEAWMPLVCFSYGVAAKRIEDGKRSKRKEKEAARERRPPPLEASSLDGLRSALGARRLAADAKTAAALRELPVTKAEITEEERYLDLRLSTVMSASFSGQMVEDDGRLVYLSLAATPSFLDAKA